MLEGCLKNISWVLQVCFQDRARDFQEWSKGDNKEVFKVLQANLKVVSRMCQEHLKDFSRKSQAEPS